MKLKMGVIEFSDGATVTVFVKAGVAVEPNNAISAEIEINGVVSGVERWRAYRVKLTTERVSKLALKDWSISSSAS